MGLRTSAPKARVELHDIADASAGSSARIRRGWRKRRARRSTHRGDGSVRRVSARLLHGSSVGRRRWIPRGLAILFSLIAAARIAATYHVFSNTYDEPLHIAAGMERLAGHPSAFVDDDTPFPKVVAALGPRLIGASAAGLPNQYFDGDSVLKSGRGYRANLDAARLAMLPFFLLTCLAVYLWARHVAGETAAAVSVLVLTLTPPVLAHAGLATTDVAGIAGLTAGLLATSRWLDRPTAWSRTLALGAAGGLALATKLSAIPYLGVGAVLMLVLRWRTDTLGHAAGQRGHRAVTTAQVLGRLAAAGAVAFVVLFASTGFEVGTLRGVPFPMPSLVHDVMFLWRHNRQGHAGYLLGQTYVGGRLAFFPVMLGVKTPLPLLMLCLAGIVASIRAWSRTRRPAWLDPLIAATGMLVVAMASNMNLGVRHVLGMYPVFALLAGIAATVVIRGQMRARTLARVAVACALCWLAWGTWRAHPDYLAWFNELGGDEPGRIAVDSDLDWGQDLDRLADTVRARGITSLSLAYYGTTRHASAVLPEFRRIGRADPEPRATGWFAISETPYRRGTGSFVGGVWTQYPHAYDWLRAYTPVARVGRSIRLYYIPANATEARGTADSAAVSAGMSPSR